MMLGKAQFELQKFVDGYVKSFDTVVKLYHGIFFNQSYYLMYNLYAYKNFFFLYSVQIL